MTKLLQKIKLLSYFDIILLFSAMGLIWTKPFNIGNRFFNLNTGSEFLGLIARPADLVLIVLILYFLVKLYNTNQKLIKKIFKDKLIIISIFGLIALSGYWIYLNQNTWYSFKNGFLYLIAFILALILIKKTDLKLLLALIPYFIFDHIIISSSVAILILFSLGVLNLGFKTKHFTKLFKIIPFLIFTILSLNFILALFQVTTGRSLGLSWLGEAGVNVETVGGVAKQIIPFIDQTLLRGYGLMPHPNILGLLGLFGIFSSRKFKKVLKLKTLSKLLNINQILGFVLVILSMSRMSFLGLGIFYSLNLLQNQFLTTHTLDSISWPKLKLNKTVSNLSRGFSFLILSLLSVFLISNFIPTRSTSDSYRIEQHQFWLDLVKQNELALLFGLGPGQYANNLQKSNLTFYNWQNEAFYQPFGNFLLENGLIGMVFWLVLAIKLDRNFDKIIFLEKT